MPIRSIAPPILRLPTILLVGVLAGCAGALSGCAGAPDAVIEETEPAARTGPHAAAHLSTDDSSRTADGNAGLVLLLACDRAYVRAGGEIPVRVILQNRSAAPIRAACPKHNRYESYRVIVKRADGTELPPSDDPYFYVSDPMIRSGFELTPVLIPDGPDETLFLPAGLEWEGRVGSTLISCAGEGDGESYVRPTYLTIDEPGRYEIRCVYRFERAAAERLRREWGEYPDLSHVPELDIASNILEVTVLPAPSSEDGDEEEAEE